MVLRRPAMPAILVETHNALDPRETARWDEAYTRKAFTLALARGLVAVAPEGGPGAPRRPSGITGEDLR